MTDSTLCLDWECPMRVMCRRYRAPAALFGQSWFWISPRYQESCSQLLPLDGSKTRSLEDCDSYAKAQA